MRPAYIALRIAERFGQSPEWILDVEAGRPELFAMLAAYERIRRAEQSRDVEAAAVASALGVASA